MYHKDGFSLRALFATLYKSDLVAGSPAIRFTRKRQNGWRFSHHRARRSNDSSFLRGLEMETELPNCTQDGLPCLLFSVRSLETNSRYQLTINFQHPHFRSVMDDAFSSAGSYPGASSSDLDEPMAFVRVSPILT